MSTTLTSPMISPCRSIHHTQRIIAVVILARHFSKLSKEKKARSVTSWMLIVAVIGFIAPVCVCVLMCTFLRGQQKAPTQLAIKTKLLTADRVSFTLFNVWILNFEVFNPKELPWKKFTCLFDLSWTLSYNLGVLLIGFFKPLCNNHAFTLNLTALKCNQ